ncbi:uncharacterized protein LOC131034027 [Cryptomeria japonica]|uniref:uncharacterized protein LOC131034027 n=1 Tax=Cryptomeria japonica TaxID=3369 RepID=UPI0027D9E15C|nr:uncharacterized protein LOC131034027 [Cryptomeria japonica]
MKGGNVVVNTFSKHVVLDNGIVKVTLSKPHGAVTEIEYGGISNLMETLNVESHRGYWDINWKEAGGHLKLDLIEGSEFSVVTATEEQAEVSFVRRWDSSLQGSSRIPVNIDLRYILLRGSSGFYAYAIYERPSGFPACELVQTRMVFRLGKDKFDYMVISDHKQREMPTEDDRKPGRCRKLAYPEAVWLTNPVNSDFKGQVDCKYQYSLENKDGGVYGWISSSRSTSTNPMVGFWVIFPSHEFRNGGPNKQNLTLHAGPICLAMFHSSHYIGDNSSKFGEGEAWQKVFGPVYIHLNSSVDRPSLWQDAKNQKLLQEQLWPYTFPASPGFIKKEERCSIMGRLWVNDKFISSEAFPADSAYVGLAAQGENGSWQMESKGYQFWTKTDKNGNFQIHNICPNQYNLYGWVPNIVGDYKNETILTLSPGSSTNLGDLTYTPPRNGATIWEIGFPDRTATKFYVPQPKPMYSNTFFLNSEKFRQYGLWERYADLFPNSDLVYTVGVDDYRKDWFFAHVTRKQGDGTNEATTWQVKFNLDKVIKNGHYTLLISIASSTASDLQVYFNNPNLQLPHFETHQIGKDNSIARHGSHGLYQIFNVQVDYSWLSPGNNTIFLKQRIHTSPFNGILYDYIRLEQPTT